MLCRLQAVIADHDRPKRLRFHLEPKRSRLARGPTLALDEMGIVVGRGALERRGPRSYTVPVRDGRGEPVALAEHDLVAPRSLRLIQAEVGKLDQLLQCLGAGRVRHTEARRELNAPALERALELRADSFHDLHRG